MQAELTFRPREDFVPDLDEESSAPGKALLQH